VQRSVYTGAKTGQISFPLGGIGSGCIGLAGNGSLIDWEIYNRPNKGGTNGFSHFAVKAEAGGKVLDARVLNGDLPGPYMGQLGATSYSGFGWGPARERMAGMPHFRGVTFRGEFPIATLNFKEPKFPGRVSLTAFNPLIPTNDLDSSIPAALFEIEIVNPTAGAITYTVCGTLGNPLPAGNVHRVRKVAGARLLHFRSDSLSPEELAYGDLTIATDARDVSCQPYWFKGRWFDSLETYWRDLTTPGELPARRYPPAKAGAGNDGTLAARIRLRGGQAGKVRFVIAWNFPNCENYWDKSACRDAAKACVPCTWKNYYATIWKDSPASAAYALTHWDRLARETRCFKDALFASDLPPAALDAVSANLSVLKTPTVLRLADGTFYGWEGCHASAGCCEGSCTHVWNYAQALPFLFPKLERSMRDANYAHNQSPDGAMAFRLWLPLGRARSRFPACADGQFGDVLKMYRDWKICGDTDWLRGHWPAIKQSIEYAWSPENIDRWDPDRRGVLTGRTHHTLDMELLAPNSWLTGFYLGALKAAAEMGRALGDAAAAEDYAALFAKGKAWADEHLFNGEYYQQRIDLSDKSVLTAFGRGEKARRREILNAYWDAEHKQIKYQIGDGCEIDQVLAQWHADLYGLGEVFDPRQTRKALKALFRHNFKKPMREHYNPCRIYCLNDEAGLVICDWPDGTAKPRIPLTYAQETMHGYEYAAAIHMIGRGLVKEGMAVVESIRDRYDGERRNPWNEIECGSNYARSMAAYALLNAFAGLQFDMVAGRVGFDPIFPAKSRRFRCFWSLAGGWGQFAASAGAATLTVLYGRLELRGLDLPYLRSRAVRSVRLGKRAVGFDNDKGRLSFHRPVVITPKAPLTLRHGR